MNLFKNTLLLSIFFLSCFQSVNAQMSVFTPGVGGYSFFQKGSVNIGLSAVKIPKANLTPGMSLGFEVGGAHVKMAMGMGITLAKTKVGTIYIPVDPGAIGNSTLEAFDSKVGYISAALGAKYYLKDIEEETGSNFYAGISLVFQVLSQKTINENNLVQGFLTSHQDRVLMGYGAGFSAGYIYAFDSGFKLTSSIGYDHNLFVLREFSDFDFSKLNVFTVGVGIQYNFDMNLGNMSGYGRAR